MNHLKALRFRHWLLIGYAIPVLSLLLSLAMTAVYAREVRLKSESLERSSEIQNRVLQVYADIQIVFKFTRSYLLSQDSILLDRIADIREQYQSDLNQIGNLLQSPEDRQALIQIEQLIRQLKTANNQLITLAQQGQVEEAVQLWRDGSERIDSERLSDAIARLVEQTNRRVEQTQKSQKEALKTLQRLELLSTIFALFVSAGAGIIILSWASRQLQFSARQITTSSTEISRSVTQQENITNQQAGSIQETSVTMEELRQLSGQSVRQVKAAKAEAQQVLLLARRGTQAVERTLQGMATLQENVAAVAAQSLRLREQADRIGKISALVGDLANQTHVLALNTAVESARSGVSGRGFAVIATEIRKLAVQSQRSVQEINGLVTEIQGAVNQTVTVATAGNQTVERGMHITHETATTFSEVMDAVNKIVLNSQQVAAAFEQQATAIEQVVNAMTQLNHLAQDTVSGIEQVKSATQHLNSAAIALQTFV